MILNNNYKSVEIDITTYKREQRVTHIYDMSMNENIKEKGHRQTYQNRFICSICLNKKTVQEEFRNIECCKRKSRSCPVCQRNCESDENKNTTQCRKKENKIKEDKCIKTKSEVNDGNDTYIQTSQPDVTQGLTLLNEVLTVFQSKKQSDNKNKTIMVKDASIETNIKRKPNLTVSKTISYSIEEHYERKDQNGKFSIINCQPEIPKMSQFSIDLKKHKSSSIPQMKLEELKNSLKEKTKSKDAIEEVNRMFATVRKNEIRESLDDSNRPMIRNGPRVLPVVKTNCSVGKNLRQDMQNCNHCQPSYHNMSSGDSCTRYGCCQPERCDKYCSSCCHYKHYRCLNAEKVCDHCCSINKE